MGVRRVWIDDWQMQCCGEPFAIGSRVTWTTYPISERDWFAGFLDAATAAAITDHEDHHSSTADPSHVRSGAVRSIDAVFCRYRRRGKTMSPIEGSGVLLPRTSADGWEDDDPSDDGLRFVGYLVDLDTAPA
jgi:hypothetical protein